MACKNCIMAYTPDRAIEIDKIVAARAKGRKIPRFLLNWMKKLIHQDMINSYLVQGYDGVEFCEKCLEYLDVKVDVKGLENIDTSGNTKYTFVSNHPLGGIDGVTLGMVIGKPFGGNIRYLVNDFLMNLKGLAPLCVPVNKVGGQSRDLARLVDEAFRSENQMLIFPAGKCSRRIDGKIQDPAWTKTFVVKSVATGRQVVPVHFLGRNSNRFYMVDKICKLLHIKFNLAMALLPDEMMRNMHGTFRIVIGKPVPAETFDDSRTPLEWAKWVRKKVYELE